MKKLLLFSMIFLGCNSSDIKEVKEEDSIDVLLRKSDSVLVIHEKVRAKNEKVLNDLIEKYSDTLKKHK
jgi:hypothetical protein